MTKMLAVYFRKDRFYVAPKLGGAGFHFDGEPVIECSRDADELADAIHRTCSSMPEEPISKMPNLRNYRSPVFIKAGIKSAAKFEQGLVYCSITRDNTGWTLQPYRWRKDGKGFEPEVGESQVIPATESTLAVARVVLLLVERKINSNQSTRKSGD
jgi:hypothetical protein